MASAKDALRTQRRRELDARRSRSRVRLGSSLQGWGKLKDQLGFSLHSQMAQFLLQRYAASVPTGPARPQSWTTLPTPSDPGRTGGGSAGGRSL
uniref:Uncharacterized protein n=1 Tax=Electrophorus electricus TaxID=8005 RepID=A0A4W4GJ11_ELEEL